MGEWEILAVLIVILALLGTKAVNNWRSPKDQGMIRLGLLMGVVFIAAGVVWYFAIRFR